MRARGREAGPQSSGNLGRQSRHFRLGGRDPDPRFQSADDRDFVSFAVRFFVDVIRNENVGCRARDKDRTEIECGGQNADDDARLAIDGQCLPQDLRFPPESRFPEAVGEDGDAASAPLTFPQIRKPAQGGLDAEYVEEVWVTTTRRAEPRRVAGSWQVIGVGGEGGVPPYREGMVYNFRSRKVKGHH